MIVGDDITVHSPPEPSIIFRDRYTPIFDSPVFPVLSIIIFCNIISMDIPARDTFFRIYISCSSVITGSFPLEKRCTIPPDKRPLQNRIGIKDLKHYGCCMKGMKPQLPVQYR